MTWCLEIVDCATYIIDGRNDLSLFDQWLSTDLGWSLLYFCIHTFLFTSFSFNWPVTFEMHTFIGWWWHNYDWWEFFSFNKVFYKTLRKHEWSLKFVYVRDENIVAQPRTFYILCRLCHPTFGVKYSRWKNGGLPGLEPRGLHMWTLYHWATIWSSHQQLFTVNIYNLMFSKVRFLKQHGNTFVPTSAHRPTVNLLSFTYLHSVYY